MSDFDSVQVVIDPAKLRDYCLSTEHPRGKHKARVFQSVLGISRNDWRSLEAEIRKALDHAAWEFDGEDRFGRRFHVDLRIGISSRTGQIRTLWIVRNGEKYPRLTSCFVHP
ncbi:MAG: DUF6883 domain-containing protein [Puniceicoccales bacterium]